MNSLFPDICSTALPESKQFYASLFGMKPVFDIDWYLHMQAEHDARIQIAFVSRSHSSVPREFQSQPAGVIVTFEYDEIDELYERARQLDVPVVVELRDEEYGQRHFIVKDPNGLLVDVVKSIEPSPEFAKKYL